MHARSSPFDRSRRESMHHTIDRRHDSSRHENSLGRSGGPIDGKRKRSGKSSPATLHAMHTQENHPFRWIDRSALLLRHRSFCWSGGRRRRMAMPRHAACVRRLVRSRVRPGLWCVAACRAMPPCMQGARARACMHASCPLVHMQVQA